MDSFIRVIPSPRSRDRNHTSTTATAGDDGRPAVLIVLHHIVFAKCLSYKFLQYLFNILTADRKSAFTDFTS